MKQLTLDFETYYDTDYSLRRMSPAEYILDPRFECTGLAVKRGSEPTFWIEGDQVQQFFDNEPEDVMCISHNSLFDMCICAWRYGWVPKMMVDTLGISRSLYAAFLKSLSLDNVAKYLGLGKKTGALANVKGMRLNDIRANKDLYASFIDYGLNDADLCYGIFQSAVPTGKFPMRELFIMNSVLRCAVVPQFVTNTDVLNESLAKIKLDKENTLAQAMFLGANGKSALMSNDQFADLLRANGVEPPRKVSPLTGKSTYAFAKSDQEFLDLLEHPDFAVQTLVNARMGHKSTIEETRHERFINIANALWPTTKRYLEGYHKFMPMPLKIGGAHTHRLSGDWSMNVQNMGRGSTLRRSLEAPEGYVVVAGDESQIEARFVAALCLQEDLREAFERGEDVYRIFAAFLFNKPPADITKLERFIGKQCILGLGYNLGHEKFGKSLPVLAWNQLQVKLDLPEGEPKRIVDAYRLKYYNIKNTWKLLGEQGIKALSGSIPEWQWGPVLFKKEEILLPNGMSLYYHNLRQVEGGKFGTEWIFEYNGKIKRCYGGMLLENITQALARIVVMEAAIRIEARLAKLGIRMALQVHDELVFVVKKEHEQIVRMVMEHELRVRPAWMPTVPLDCEVGAGPNYGDAK